MLRLFYVPRHPIATTAGFALLGLVYGCYGLFAGSLFRRELEGVFSIVLLTNIDIAWLQNPVIYAEAQHRSVIRALPGYFPSQVSMTAAFSDHPTTRARYAAGEQERRRHRPEPERSDDQAGDGVVVAELAGERWRFRVDRVGREADGRDDQQEDEQPRRPPDKREALA